MIRKEELYKGLGRLVDTEEGLVTLYANFDKVLVKLDKDITEEKREKIQALLSTLHRDSSGHRDTIYEMMDKIKASDKNEY
ncbi:MAG: hypothetical protein KJ995_03405 [Candidatus Omnitrophica bacterium]|nr:hypothetical protein [Candidatus Omnitrophota bacterium]MBU1127608.1 hypothetical protein [Candidatus Omnitrophota bacterium]MBU1783895.1 hypothetical protein [Candidatus Omnitrophota bacterium]MBU1851433.1 hypothetical protein [Candidatus Omnitrophota bacterium]